jgi:predicted MarR family transcription regulator
MSATSLAAALTRLELGVMRAHEALGSWAVEAHKHLVDEPFDWQEVAVLHCVRLRGENPTLAELLLFLHRHDLAALQYCLRRLERYGLIHRSRAASRREISYAITDKGRELTDAYVRFRQELLVELLSEVVGMEQTMAEAAGALERLIGMYDQAQQLVLNRRLTDDLRERRAVSRNTPDKTSR